MFGTLKHLTKTFRAPATAEREFIYITAGINRFELEARERHVVARGFCHEQVLG